MTSFNPRDIIKERHETHGDFSKNAEVSQNLKEYIKSSSASLTNVQLEVIDMICLKLSRIVSGRANEIDHWQDISGYAMLAVQEIEIARISRPFEPCKAEPTAPVGIDPKYTFVASSGIPGDENA